jgi:non-heme chloroperoxidase
MTDTPTPVVFIHGLWLHADSWGAWADFFGKAGYEPSAPGWPGDSDSVDATRKSPEAVAGKGVADIVAHYAAIIDALPTKPILIGHSFGGLLVQRLLDEGRGVAGVAIDAAPIKGVLYLPPSALRVASVVLRNPVNRSRAVSLTPQQFRYGFGNAVSAEESAEMYSRWTIPSPGKPLFEAAAANLNPGSPCKVDTSNATRGPLLLVAGGADHAVPPSITRATMRLYRKSPAITDYQEFPGKGHSLALDSGWDEVADAALTWLRSQGV